MKLFRKKSRQETHKCPVCLENILGTERTLSCGHVFCHDCLVETLVGKHDGQIGGTITCPICKHLTFISRQKASFMSQTSEETPDGGQILAVPHLSPFGQLRSAGRALHHPAWIPSCFKSIIRRVRPPRTTDHSVSQIFVISTQGRPKTKEELLNGAQTVVQQHRRQRRRVCTTARCLLLLLFAVIMLAVAAVTLPRILLV